MYAQQAGRRARQQLAGGIGECVHECMVTITCTCAGAGTMDYLIRVPVMPGHQLGEWESEAARERREEQGACLLAWRAIYICMDLTASTTSSRTWQGPLNQGRPNQIAARDRLPHHDLLLHLVLQGEGLRALRLATSTGPRSSKIFFWVQGTCLSRTSRKKR